MGCCGLQIGIRVTRCVTGAFCTIEVRLSNQPRPARIHVDHRSSSVEGIWSPAEGRSAALNPVKPGSHVPFLAEGAGPLHTGAGVTRQILSAMGRHKPSCANDRQPSGDLPPGEGLRGPASFQAGGRGGISGQGQPHSGQMAGPVRSPLENSIASGNSLSEYSQSGQSERTRQRTIRVCHRRTSKTGNITTGTKRKASTGLDATFPLSIGTTAITTMNPRSGTKTRTWRRTLRLGDNRA